MTVDIDVCPYCNEPITDDELSCRWSAPVKLRGWDRPARWGTCYWSFRQPLTKDVLITPIVPHEHDKDAS